MPAAPVARSLSKSPRPALPGEVLKDADLSETYRKSGDKSTALN